MCQFHSVEFRDRPTGAFLELALTFSDEELDRLRRICPRTMDVVRLRPEPDEHVDDYIDMCLQRVQSKEHEGRYARILIFNSNEQMYSRSLDVIRRKAPRLLAEWRVFTVSFADSDPADDAMDRALGSARPLDPD